MSVDGGGCLPACVYYGPKKFVLEEKQTNDEIGRFGRKNEIHFLTKTYEIFEISDAKCFFVMHKCEVLYIL